MLETLQVPGNVLVDIAILDGLLIVMIVLYGRIDRPAAWMLVPYAVWLGLATAINIWIVLNN